MTQTQRPDFHRFHNGSKVALPFSDAEYEARLTGLRSIMDDAGVTVAIFTSMHNVAYYSGRTQDMEMRLPAFAPGTRVLLVDQWVETGGTMDGSVRLVERQGGVIAGMVALAIEENERTHEYRSLYPCITAVMLGSRWHRECNSQTLSSFAHYKPEAAFPQSRR